jgi:hypothetical protein
VELFFRWIIIFIERQFNCVKMKGNQMNNKPKSTSIRFTLLAVAGLLTSAVSGHAQGAVATISGVAVSGGFDYTILLQDTGSGNLNSFWYGWTSSGNNLPSNPSGATNSLGWNNTVFGNSIEWVNSSGTALTPGHSGTFFFFSTSAPAAITTPPSGESVAYVNGITFTQNLPGDSTPAFSPTLVVPEPSSVALLAVGALGLLASGWRKLRAN